MIQYLSNLAKDILWQCQDLNLWPQTLSLVFFLHHYSVSHLKDPSSQAPSSTSSMYREDIEVHGHLRTT